MPIKRFRRNYKKGASKYKKGSSMLKKVRVAKRRNMRIHNFKRTVEMTALYSSSAGSAGGYTFQINSLPDALEFQKLYDKYRIRGVQIKLVPSFTSSDANPIASAVYVPNVHSAVDTTDATTPTSVGELMQYSTYRMSRGLQVHKRYFVPRFASEVYRSSVSTNYAMGSKNTWLDCSSAGCDIPHFALKYWIDGSSVTSFQWRVYVTYYFQCCGFK